jgi:ribosome-associated toxin RatA of RatAB toxin-antitoxin module
MADTPELNDENSQFVDDEIETLEDALRAGFSPAMLQEVEVQSHAVEGRQRQIEARIKLPHAVEQVWKVLTDYDALANFIPNLAKSQRVEHPTGGIRIEQVGTQRLLRFNFSARVVLDMEEKYPYTINFNMVEGDFKAFSGYWQLEPIAVGQPASGTNLTYVVLVLPKRFMPISIIERRLQKDLAINLLSIREKLNQLFR